MATKKKTTTKTTKAAVSQGREVPAEGRDDPERRDGSAFRVYGYTGLRRTGKTINEEYDPRLKGKKAVRVYTEMGDNSYGIGAALLLIESLISQVNFRFQPKEGAPAEAAELAEWFEGCRLDMESTWAEFLYEAVTLVQFGWSSFEVLFKVRRGSNASPLLDSRFDDGLIGWRDFAPRSQDSIDEWAIDDEGSLLGFWQDVESMPGNPFVPRSKLLHFAIRARKRNPQGRSPLRAAYRPYFFRVMEEEYEAIGIERNLDGLPVAYVPPEYLVDTATAAQKELVSEIFKMVRRIRRDEIEGIVYPAKTDAQGNPTGFELTSFISGNDVSKADPVIKRHASHELTALLSSFLELGSTEVGGWALHDSATNLLAHALGAVLRVLCDEINARAVPQLGRLNGFDAELLPELVHDDIEKMDLARASQFFSTMVQSGGIVPGPKDEDWIRQLGHLPPREEDAPPRPMPASETEIAQRLDDFRRELDR